MPPARETAPAAAEPLIGLPGPATLAPTFAAAAPAAEPVAEASDTPAPRKRGRPRKVVAADSLPADSVAADSVDG